MRDRNESSAASSGISGLDEILAGGFPRDRLHLIQGDPGVGKTTLGLQFLLEGARRRERGLYITLSESEDEIRAVAASHGWTLDSLSLFELSAAEQTLKTEADNTVFLPAEVQLREVVDTLLKEVERVKPDRVVFDSLSEVRLLAQSSLQYRRQILLLKQYFAGKHSTVLLMDDRTAPEGDPQLQSLAHGVISMEQLPQGYGTERRRLRVVKLRGLKYRGGYHDYTIATGGLQIFPRLVAAEHQRPVDEKVLPSGLAELDGLLGGGLHHGTSTLLLGPAGSGKSSIMTHFAVAAADQGMKAAIYAFDEGAGTLYSRSEALGLKLAEHVRAGRITVSQIDPAELAPDEFAQGIRHRVERDGVSFVAIDSLNGYRHALPDERFLTVQLHALLSFLAQNGVVTMLVMAQHGGVGSGMLSPVDVSYLADSVVLLRYFESRGYVRKAISILKKRSGAHEASIREFSLGKGGLKVGEPLTDFQGVLTGTPQYTGQSAGLLNEIERAAQKS